MSQKSSLEIIKHLDQKIWDQLALKAVSKMPKVKLSQQTNKIFKDFVFMNNKTQQKQTTISEDLDPRKQLVDNLLPNFHKIVDKRSIYNQSNGLVQPSTQYNKQPIDPIFQSSKKEQAMRDTFTSTIKKIYTEPANIEEMDKDDRMRKSMQQRRKYTKDMTQISGDQLMQRQLRVKSEMKKVKQLREFTYDYAGKIVPLKSIKNSNSNINKLKTKFSNDSKNRIKLKIHRQKVITDIKQIKKIINNRNDFYQHQQDGGKQLKNNKNFHYNAQNTLLSFFKQDSNVAMGVSITDFLSKTKIQNKSLAKSNLKEMKLKEYKEYSELNNTSLKQSMALYFMRKTMKSKKSMTQQAEKQDEKRSHDKLKTYSNAQSRLFSSSFASGFSKMNGSIAIKNMNKFSQFFEKNEQ